ncbi:hypothetical protein KKG83_06905 [Candidatus Micrarchaeota archaeon]|nr:hypothetical protein [Candidatus Micrarchaeota archaeon]MBU2477173.1 hypothetical protein [Candidatus Micrarchaeota archaeon]
MGLEVLGRIGLTPNEIKIYDALVSLGSSQAGEIIKKTGLFRPRVYDALDRLIGKGLVSFVVINGVKNFQASNPQRLADYIEEKELELKELRETEVSSLIKALEKKRSLPATDIKVYMGFKGVKLVLDDMLNELKHGGSYVAFAGGQFKSKMGIYYEKFQNKKKLFTVKSKFLYDESMKEQKDILERTYGKWRFHEKKYHSPTDLFIFNDKIIMTIWNAEPYFAICIKNEEVAKIYRDYFKLIWKISKS